jgi:hypothetical protein
MNITSASNGKYSEIYLFYCRVTGLYTYEYIVGLERGPLSLVSTIEELLGRNNSGSGLENREYGRWDPLR